MGKPTLVSSVSSAIRFSVLSCLVIAVVISILGCPDPPPSGGGGGFTFNAVTTQMDCDTDKINIASTVSGVYSQASGSYLTGNITITCTGSGPVSGVTITSSTLWFASVGPSDTNGVIDAAGQNLNLRQSDVGTHTVNITAKGKDPNTGDDAEIEIPITITIN